MKLSLLAVLASRNNNATISISSNVYSAVITASAAAKLSQRWNRVSGSPGQRFWPGRVGSRISVSDLVFDPVLSFNMRVYRGVVSTE